jgi:hypothetical protein
MQKGGVMMKTKVLPPKSGAKTGETTGQMPSPGLPQTEPRIDILPSKTAMKPGGAGSYVPMVFHGGPLITAPELIAFYWGPFQQSEIDGMQAYLAGFAAFLCGEGAPLRQEPVVSQYGMVGGTRGASYHVATAPSHATDADVHTQVTTLQAQGHLPPFGPERLFLVFTKGIQFQDYGTVWCAYHGAWGGGQYYAICPYPAAGGCGQNQPIQSWQSVTSHEILEAITDPSVGGGWTEGSEEGGDTCAWQELAVSFGTIQLFADNRQQACSAWTMDVGKISVVSWGPERLDIFVIGTDAALYHKYWSPSTGWGPSIGGYERLGGVILGNPMTVSWAFERLDIFVIGTDRALYHKYWSPSTGWGPSVNDYERLGGVIVGSPTVVSWGPERLDIFVRGTDLALYHKYWSPTTGWGPSVNDYERLGGVIVADPVAVSWAFERLDIFVVGTDAALYHKYWGPSTGWGPSVSGYERLGGVVVGMPTVVSWGPERLDIFVRGTDLALYHKYWSPATGWGPSLTDYERLGGVIVADPVAVSWEFERLDIFVIGTDQALYHKYWSPSSGWGPSVNDYERLGGVILGSPSVVSWAPERLDIFVVGTDRALYHKYWSPATGWKPSVLDYERLGGVIAAPPKLALVEQPEIAQMPVAATPTPPRMAAARPKPDGMPE